MAATVQPGTPGAAIIAEEEDLHTRVQARAASDLTEATQVTLSSSYEQDLIELRDAIAEAKPEDLAPLVEQMTRLAALRGAVGGSQTLPIDSASPYFAHMVLEEGGKRRDVLVGKRGFIDRAANIQIVDWRNAPISQIYYRYDEGDDYEEEIAGRTLRGVVAVRRNVSINRANLRRIGAPQGTFVRGRDGQWRTATAGGQPTLYGGQGTAARAPRPRPRRVDRGGRRASRLGVDSDHAPRADKHLPEIAALIDGEQFDLITRPTSGIVAIQGGAGSGKTTVALHRIAFLTFSDAKIKPRSVVFVVPSRSLVRYVADVLPALGVHNVPVFTYAEWAERTRLKLLQGSSGKYNTDTPEVVSRVKKHPRIEAALVDHVARQTAEVGAAIDEATRGRPRGEVVSAQWRELEGTPLVPRLRRLRFWAERANLPPELAVALESAVRRWLRRADDIVEDWGEVLTDAGRLEAVFEGADGISSGDLEAAIRWVSDQLSELDDSGVEAVDGRGDDDHPGGRFDREDDPVMLRLVQLKRGGLLDDRGKETVYQHVAVDEVQDRSAIEIKVLLEAAQRTRRDDPASRSITLAGDMAQRVVFDNHIESWDQLLECAGLRGTEVSPLRISYRSTAEVMQLARQILGSELDSGDPLIARSGAPVELHELGDIGEAVAFLSDSLRNLMHREPTASAVVLTRYPEQADAYYAGLSRAEIPRLRRVRRDDFAFTPGVDVTEVSQVKGLEFDYVIMVDVNRSVYPDNRESRHLLHIGATRAAHQLWIVSSGDPSPLLPESE